MDAGKIFGWIEAHPAESGVIGVGGLIFVLWIFGAFSKGASSADAGTANMAAAYYAAEAQQAVVGGQIQMANIAANASTSTALAGDAAAVSINHDNTIAATTINKQNVGGAVKMTASNNAAATTINAANNKTSLISQFLGSILPAEFATYGTTGFQTTIPGTDQTFTSGVGASPADMRRLGYGPQTIAAAGGA